MPASLLRVSCFVLAGLLGAGAAKVRQETLFLFENRQVAFAMPAGFGFATSKNEQGIFTVLIADRKDRAALQMTFLPDPQGRFGAARSRRELIFENFQHFVDASVEKTMQFEELEPRTGTGTYCVFTDAALAGKTKVPPHSYLRSVAGVKAWPGVVAVFTLQSNGTATKEHQLLMSMLRESVQEISSGLK